MPRKKRTMTKYLDNHLQKIKARGATAATHIKDIGTHHLIKVINKVGPRSIMNPERKEPKKKVKFVEEEEEKREDAEREKEIEEEEEDDEEEDRQRSKREKKREAKT